MKKGKKKFSDLLIPWVFSLGKEPLGRDRGFLINGENQVTKTMEQHSITQKQMTKQISPLFVDRLAVQHCLGIEKGVENIYCAVNICLGGEGCKKRCKEGVKRRNEMNKKS